MASLPDPVASDLVATETIAVPDASISAIRHTMSRYLGVRRSGSGLAAAASALEGLRHPTADTTCMVDAANRWTVAGAIVAAATARRESRGCHWRADYPVPSDTWMHRIVVRLDESGLPFADSELALGRSA